MSKDTIIKTRVVDMFADRGNRVYRLKPAPAERSAFVNIDFGKFANEKLYFYNVKSDGTVDANVHHCSDLNDLGNDVYYAWQPRLPRMPTTCPRCKSRLDRVSTRGV